MDKRKIRRRSSALLFWIQPYSTGNTPGDKKNNLKQKGRVYHRGSLHSRYHPFPLGPVRLPSNKKCYHPGSVRLPRSINNEVLCIYHPGGGALFRRKQLSAPHIIQNNMEEGRRTLTASPHGRPITAVDTTRLWPRAKPAAPTHDLPTWPEPRVPRSITISPVSAARAPLSRAAECGELYKELQQEHAAPTTAAAGVSLPLLPTL